MKRILVLEHGSCRNSGNRCDFAGGRENSRTAGRAAQFRSGIADRPASRNAATGQAFEKRLYPAN